MNGSAGPGQQVIDTTISLNHFANLPGYGIYESSAAGSHRNSYTDNKFANIGLAAVYISMGDYVIPKTPLMRDYIPIVVFH